MNMHMQRFSLKDQILSFIYIWFQGGICFWNSRWKDVAYSLNISLWSTQWIVPLLSMKHYWIPRFILVFKLSHTAIVKWNGSNHNHLYCLHLRYTLKMDRSYFKETMVKKCYNRYSGACRKNGNSSVEKYCSVTLHDNFILLTF